MKYTITLTEPQMRIMQNALEEYFRLRLGQPEDFSDDLAFMGKDLSKENPKHKTIFNECLENKEFIYNQMQGIFHTIWPPYGVPDRKSDDMLIAECIWDAIRLARGMSRWPDVLKVGTEPVPEITKIPDEE